MFSTEWDRRPQKPCEPSIAASDRLQATKGAARLGRSADANIEAGQQPIDVDRLFSRSKFTPPGPRKSLAMMLMRKTND
ncbi:hypothetical protein BMI90_11750 [Thioclava sp. L04-15]|nr:hypothetical protein BMI90_11750 [Thioclava sp. L04-15]